MMGWLPQIPRRFLPDSMGVRVPDGCGGFADAVEVSHVRFVRTQSACDDAHRSADASAGKVYVDAVNSCGVFDIPAGSRVDIGGDSFYVAKVRRCEGFGGRLHHLELAVR